MSGRKSEGCPPLITREVRWFFDGSLIATNPAVADWFAGANDGSAFVRPVHRHEWRVDCYLCLPTTRDVGIKLRQGRLEIKGCHARVGVRRLAADVEGEVSCWTKWAIGGSGWSNDLERKTCPAGLATLRIAKQRMQRSVRLTDRGFSEVTPGQEAGAGLQMELTRLQVAGAGEELLRAGVPRKDTHWTLGFEAFPDGLLCRALFENVVLHLLEGCPARPLRAASSMSYPEWLQRLGGGAVSSDG